MVTGMVGKDPEKDFVASLSIGSCDARWSIETQPENSMSRMQATQRNDIMAGELTSTRDLDSSALRERELGTTQLVHRPARSRKPKVRCRSTTLTSTS